MENRIASALTRQFERHRIVFWYDTRKELRDEFELIDLPGVEKLVINNNEFSLKYRILREKPEQKFLLYHEGPQPPDIENWLLDVFLGYGKFQTDQVALWRSELELDMEFTDLMQQHKGFFLAVKRKEALKKLLCKDDTARMIRMKMLSVCAGSDARLDAVLEILLKDLAEGRDDKIKLINRCDLDAYLWEQVNRYYGYKSDNPGLDDFSIELFKSCYALATDGQVRLTGDAVVFLKRWMDSRQHGSSFEVLSNQAAEVLSIEQDLGNRDFRELIELDYFSLIDQKIINDLIKAVLSRIVTGGEVTLWIRQRRQSHWYEKYRYLYEAVDNAAQFIDRLSEVKLTMNGLSDGVRRYAKSWYLLDQLYRKFIYSVRRSSQPSLLNALVEQIENLYTNSYLLKLNNNWQTFVDKTDTWDASPVPPQRAFFDRWVLPFLSKDNKVHVIISDALRYEVGEELLSRIRQEDRYDANLKPALSMLPSYTQLGMAALLPNRELSIADDETGAVRVDGKNSQGTQNRLNIIRLNLPDKKAYVLTAEEFIAMPREGEEGYRALFRNNDVVYIYHNCIDSVGDKRDTEEKVFEAANQALEELVNIVRKLSNANVTNMLVTADHGFIFQNRAIEESDYSGVDVEGDVILYRDRRFALGRELKQKDGLRKFASSALGLTGDVEVQIPKSINRLRLKGSGSRYVHGGASLQEVVIPVLEINKKRQSDISTVEIDILRGASSVITSGQLAVSFYQSEPATDKVQHRILRAGIYTQDNELISDSRELTFDMTSENPREREVQVRFILTYKADEVNNQEVILKLEEKHAGTTHYKEYKSLRYQMRRSFTSDFDF